MRDLKWILVILAMALVLWYAVEYFSIIEQTEQVEAIVWVSEAPVDRPKVELGMRDDGVVTWREIEDEKEESTDSQ